jgi:protein-S-isoprenylcysteine O-methyltransferase Ste14
MAKVSAGIAVALFVHLWWRSFGGAGRYDIPFFFDFSNGGAILWDLALLALFSIAHSAFASFRFKSFLGLERSAMRRLYVHLTLLVTAIIWALWAPLSMPVLWNLTGIWDVVAIAVRSVSVIGLLWTVLGFSVLEFLGDARATERAGGTICVDGPFAICRHPLYLFITSFIGATTFMPLGRALLIGGIIVYFAVGSRFEERKMLREFGADYAAYRASTPWLIPTPRSLVRALMPSPRGLP